MEPSCAVRPAATVMLAREEANRVELYMLRRSSRSAFLPEVFVFPGGAVDPEDEHIARQRLLRAAQTPAPGREASDPAFEVAALREAFEEAGIFLAARRDGRSANLDGERLRGARDALLAGKTTLSELLESLDLALDARGVEHFSHWITPPTEPIRFDTHFYLAAAPRDQAASSDDRETFAGVWISPGEALRRYEAGNFPLIFPTIQHLRRLAAYDSIDAMQEFARTKEIRAVQPLVAGDRRFSFPEGLESRW